MKTKYLACVLFLLVHCPSQLFGQGFTVVFPQFADGTFSDGSFYRSTVIVQSSDSIFTQHCAIWTYGVPTPKFTNATGQVFTLSTTNELPFTLNSLRSQVFKSAGTNPISTGFIGVGCDGVDWTSYLLFSFYSPTGVKYSEAAVFPSVLDSNAPAAQLVVDQREGAQLGMAIANPDTRAGVFILTIRDSAGNFVNKASVTLPAFGQTATFLNQLVTLPANFVGTVSILPLHQYAGPTPYVIGLRFTGTASTTVPVTLCYSGDFCAN
ncbi:MAG TPA: hypothetical protein VGK48_09650 [Terriglobia bacterium]|jgi:hypothetical protein